jgi:hypothetical protein
MAPEYMMDNFNEFHHTAHFETLVKEHPELAIEVIRKLETPAAAIPRYTKTSTAKKK